MMLVDQLHTKNNENTCFMHVLKVNINFERKNNLKIFNLNDVIPLRNKYSIPFILLEMNIIVFFSGENYIY